MIHLKLELKRLIFCNQPTETGSIRYLIAATDSQRKHDHHILVSTLENHQNNELSHQQPREKLKIN